MATVKMHNTTTCRAAKLTQKDFLEIFWKAFKQKVDGFGNKSCSKFFYI